jgi:deazaflavin-dependent oxidoreductase (nitroreductase family)
MRAGPQGTADAGLVPPSRFVRIVMGPMTRPLNPLIVKAAGRRHFGMAAQIRHTGRRSGRSYTTPASARISGDVAVIPLTFGSQSDWSRNVRAAGGCSIRLNGRDYDLTQPELLSVADVQPLIRSMFSPTQRAAFRMLGIRQVMRLRVAGPRP